MLNQFPMKILKKKKNIRIFNERKYKKKNTIKTYKKYLENI